MAKPPPPYRLRRYIPPHRGGIPKPVEETVFTTASDLLEVDWVQNFTRNPRFRRLSCIGSAEGARLVSETDNGSSFRIIGIFTTPPPPYLAVWVPPTNDIMGWAGGPADDLDNASGGITNRSIPNQTAS